MYNSSSVIQVAVDDLAITRFVGRNVYQLSTRESVDPETQYVRFGKRICLTPEIIAASPDAGAFANLLQSAADDIRREIKLRNHSTQTAASNPAQAITGTNISKNTKESKPL